MSDGFRCTMLLRLFAAALAAAACVPARAGSQDEEVPAETATEAMPQDEGDEIQETPDEDEEDSADALKLDFRLMVRVNLFDKSWETGSDRKAAEFDTIAVGLDASLGSLSTSWQYRFYDGYNMLHHGYVGYGIDDTSELEVGVMKKPFGLLPYASHNWFFGLTYYMGLEDDYDLGAKLILDRGPLNLQLAYFARDEGNYYGDSIDSARYSYDIVKTDASELGAAGITGTRSNKERNQLNGRLAYTIEHGELNSTELGLSGEWGQIRNGTTGGSGYHWAAAAHLNGNYDRFNLQLQAARFSNNPDNPPGQDDRFVIRGAYDAPYKAAAKGWLLVSNVAYRFPLEWKPFDAITLYTDYSYLLKSESSFNDSQQLVIGASLEAGPALVYIDFAFGKNHPWLGPDYNSALAEGDPNADWELRFNINIGFYF